MPDLVAVKPRPIWRRAPAATAVVVAALGVAALALTYAARAGSEASRSDAAERASSKDLADLRTKVAALEVELGKAHAAATQVLNTCTASEGQWRAAVAAFARQVASCEGSDQRITHGEH